MYYFSLHFSLFGKKDSRCNWTRAASLLDYDRQDVEYGLIRKRFKSLQSVSTAYKYKDEDNHFAAFIWLDHFGDRYLRPDRPVASSFPEKLLAKVDNTAGLSDYLGKYEYIRRQLKSQDYNLPELHISNPISPQEVSVVPLSEAIAVLI